MLYNLIMVLMAVYVIILPFLMVFLIRSLLPASQPEVKPQPRKRKAQKHNVSEQDQRVLDILANIDAYDGSSHRQKPVKEL